MCGAGHSRLRHRRSEQAARGPADARMVVPDRPPRNISRALASAIVWVLPELAPASVAWARMGGRLRSGGLQQAHYGRSAAEELEPAGVGGSMLMRPGARTEEVTQFIIASTEPARRSWTLEPTHRLISTFDAAVILLQSIVEVAAGAVLHAFAQRRPDRTRIGRSVAT